MFHNVRDIIIVISHGPRVYDTRRFSYPKEATSVVKDARLVHSQSQSSMALTSSNRKWPGNDRNPLGNPRKKPEVIEKSQKKESPN